METQSHSFMLYVNAVFFWYFVLLNMIYMFLLALSANYLQKYKNMVNITVGVKLPDEFAKPFSVIVPAYNEEVHIVDAVNSLLALDYPEHEVVVCNDGSTDNTLKILIDSFALEKVDVSCPDPKYDTRIRGVYFSRNEHRLIVVDKHNTGKADALNTANQFSRYPYICAVDADSILASDSMNRLMHDFVAVPGTVARGGVVRLSNGSIVENGSIKEPRVPERMLEKIQVVEYFRAFLFGRLGLQKLNALLIISGAFGVFRRDILDAVQGWLPTAIGEDMELVVKIQKLIRDNKLQLKVGYSAYPVCWTQAPATLKQLGIQRDRWQRALSQCMIKYYKLLFNPRYGTLGLIGYPFFFIFEFLSAPLEFVGYPIIIVSYINGTLDLPFFLLFIGVACMWGLCISSASLLLAETSFKRYKLRGSIMSLFFAAFCENFGYRHIHAYWRLRGMIKYFVFGDLGWGKLDRIKYDKPAGGGK